MPTGYTLPVFACASAIAALRHLQQDLIQDTVTVNLIKPDQIVDITVEQVAKIDEYSAIAITRSDPGDHLDLTRNTPVWAKVSLAKTSSVEQITIEGGEGIGRQSQYQNQAAIYSYAK
ncbi:MAG: cobalt-precorrin-5B (C(1))-methyltransferase, partial [Waterburya sp.]